MALIHALSSAPLLSVRAAISQGTVLLQHVSEEVRELVLVAHRGRRRAHAQIGVLGSEALVPEARRGGSRMPALAIKETVTSNAL